MPHCCNTRSISTRTNIFYISLWHPDRGRVELLDECWHCLLGHTHAQTRTAPPFVLSWRHCCVWTKHLSALDVTQGGARHVFSLYGLGGKAERARAHVSGWPLTLVFEWRACKCVSRMWFGLVRFLWKGKWSPPKGLHNLWIGSVSCHRLWDCVDPKDKHVKGIVWHFGKYSYSLSCLRVLLHLSRLHLYKQMSFGMCVSSICVQIGAGTYASHIQQNTV